MISQSLQLGIIVANYGRHFLVEAEDGRRLICHSRGKKSLGVVGDRVQWQASADEGVIDKIETRQNLFYRQDEVRTKSFAANLDQIIILIAAQPEFSASQLARALIAAEAAHIKPIIILNKSDLLAPFNLAWSRLEDYRAMGYEILPLSLLHHVPTNKTLQVETLLAHLKGKKTLVLGPSGSGKSTLINALIPSATAQTGEISRALNSGKHTTTSTTLYWLDAEKEATLIDSPGFQEFGLNHIEAVNLASYMPDIRAHTAHCKFYNCSHLHEPGCGVIAALKSDDVGGGLSARRYKIYADLWTELSQSKY